MGVSGLVLRRATGADAGAIGDVYLAARAEALPYLRAAHTDEETRGWIASVVVPSMETWVAVVPAEGGEGEGSDPERGDLVVGFLALEGGELNQLYLRPGWFRRGIGSALVRLAKERRPAGLALYTFERNASARAFYERHGFRIIARSDGSQNEEREPDVRYAWTPEAQF